MIALCLTKNSGWERTQNIEFKSVAGKIFRNKDLADALTIEAACCWGKVPPREPRRRYGGMPRIRGVSAHESIFRLFYLHGKGCSSQGMEFCCGKQLLKRRRWLNRLTSAVVTGIAFSDYGFAPEHSWGVIFLSPAILIRIRYPSAAMPLQSRQSCSENTCKPPRVPESYGLK